MLLRSNKYFYYYVYEIREDNMGRACNGHGKMRNIYKIVVGKSEEELSLRRSRRIWEDNIRMDLRKIGWEGVNWIHLGQGKDQWRALVNTVMNFRVP
jgi:hypothetical protein